MDKPIDLTGMKFGRLTVLNRVKNNKDGRTMWRCMCDCGNERIVMGKCLRNGHTKSCGCLSREMASYNSLIDRTGEKYGLLTVLHRGQDYISPNGKRYVRWVCRCECGNVTEVCAFDLASGHTKSCGCKKSIAASITHTKHGGRKDRLYKVLSNMKNRCYNEKSKDYKYYGGRGITICDEWLSSYSKFKEWAYMHGYDDSACSGECTIDRIDVNGNYEPNNCRWVSMDVQSKNRRNVIKN